MIIVTLIKIMNYVTGVKITMNSTEKCSKKIKPEEQVSIFDSLVPDRLGHGAKREEIAKQIESA